MLEIGCGEGDLCAMISEAGASVQGIDYSTNASRAAIMRGRAVICSNYKNFKGEYRRIVMQGVLEHLDDPFGELAWMIERFEPKTIVTSSPGFLNPRGIVWMTLHMLGAVMSKTDLHYLNPWQFEDFCKERGYVLTMESTDNDWGYGARMVEDFCKRIPLALKDGGLKAHNLDWLSLIGWLHRASAMIPAGPLNGATICYRIDIP